MKITRYEWMMFVYNFAVVLSGAYAGWTMGIPDRFTLMGIAFGFTVVWTIYFRFVMLGRLIDHPRIVDEYDDEDEEVETRGGPHIGDL